MNVQTNEMELHGGVESAPGLKRHTLRVCGGPMNVYEAGDASRPAVVLLHGAMYDEARFIWDRMFPALAERYRVFALDTPRHGKSRPWEGKLDRERLLAVIEETFLQLGLDSFAIVGLSMGGGLAIEYAAAHPEQINAMALFEPGGLGETVTGEFFTYLYIHTPGTLRLLSKQYVRYGSARVEKILRSLYTGGSVPTDPARLTAVLMDEIRGKFENGENDLDDWQLGGIGAFRLKWNLLEQVSQIRCPTLWLRGKNSALVKQSEMERAVSLARTGGAEAELLVFPGAGHMLPLERPREANAAVLAFLDRTVR